MASRQEGVVSARPGPDDGPGTSKTAVDPGAPPECPSVELMGVRVDQVDGPGAIDRIMSSIEAEVDKFQKMLVRADRGRIRLKVKMHEGSTLATVFDGLFAAAMRR